MASYRRIEVKPIAGALGAEIAGVDLGNMDDEAFEEIAAAWLEHLVVFFRRQNITPKQQIAFAKRFGEIHHHPFMKGMDEHPEILEIIKEEGDTRAFGEVWHTDQMFNPKPAKATILYAKETPDAGGDTLFANMYLAYEALSDPMKELLEGVKTWNVGDRQTLSRNGAIGPPREGRYAGNEKMAAKVREPGDLQTECAHPLVRTHPETGRKALYISNHTQTLEGFRRVEARPILDFLMIHAVQPEFTCRFRWEVGSLAIWDNRCAQHRALNDYPGKRRRMHRITIAGDAPF
ncbi:MAG TPA: TauD/TfdA family dioxygenase [Candidatus Dormibacteraeota bacterium]